MASIPADDLSRQAGDLPEYLSRRAAAARYGADSHTIDRHVKADAWQISDKGLRYPLYRPETIEAFVAARKARQSGGAL